METLLFPLSFEFMRNALLISVLVAVPTSLLSCFLILKGWSLMGDAVSHAVLPGIVLAYIAAVPLAVGAFVAGLFCALATGFLHENSRVKQDTIMGVVFSGMFALGIVLYTKVQTELHLDHILFGDMLGVGARDLLESGVIALVVTALIALKWRDLVVHTFDETQAQASGLPVKLLHYGLLILLSLTIVGALKAVGIILAIAMLISPGAIAFLVTKRFGTMLVVACFIGTGASLAGVYASFFINSAPAPTIVMVLSGIFIVAFIHTVRRAHRTEGTG
ncbi:MAG: metal ABC transporter permease [Pseudomonadota bacterium]